MEAQERLASSTLCVCACVRACVRVCVLGGGVQMNSEVPYTNIFHPVDGLCDSGRVVSV